MENKLTASELRIGNWVEFPNLLIKQQQIVYLDARKEDTSYIQPIPLNEEWLEKFGFEKHAYSWNGKIFHLLEWDDYPLNWFVAMNKNGAVLVQKLKYVHQLQNLFYSLTNEELTINEIPPTNQTP